MISLLEKPYILGFGTWQLKGDVCVRSVSKALEVGYRHIDTADAYDNHAQVAKAIADADVPREELFITTKVWRDELKKQQVIDSGNRFLDELRLDYIDLLLIHWPHDQVPVSETLEAMQTLQEKGVIRSIGVSNFSISLMAQVLQTGITCITNQVELHPSFNQKELKEFCDLHKIFLTAYSPIGRGEDLHLDPIVALGAKYKRSPSQVILNWIISKGIVAIPKSANPDHIEDNFKALDWNLSKEDCDLIDSLDANNRIVRPGFAQF